ncbi:hypothetical protein GCK72_003004 [Caenorhabditis remanei]|uniref:F-box domain-containing protein n=1 Tax=Caenorhabditis remanei TaxID=31234 RepID=A0A6A5HTC0_CAERE|nr:hypothetical protein GCK72_003004 [Caenorhabditis remanei]KAF1771178.1 hypothetical protein GCK72_003004 [Caenorhabditis remanei]
MSSPFPLLRLPRLVLCEVFKSLSIGEKIKLSLCSKKLSIQINDARLYSQKVIVDLDMCYKKIRVHLENNEDTFDVFISAETKKTLRSNTQQFSMACCSTGIETFWANHQEGFLSIIRHLLKMFHCKISTSEGCFHSDLFQPTISKLFDLQLEFKALYIHFKRSKDENLLWNQISRNLELVECLIILSSFDTNFKLVFTSWPQSITIWDCYWFTLESLLACTSSTITLYYSHLENKDMDKILREWRAGELPNLKRLIIASWRFEENREHILGMNLLEIDGMVIQTDDGSKTATIKLGQHWIEMSVTQFQ